MANKKVNWTGVLSVFGIFAIAGVLMYALLGGGVSQSALGESDDKYSYVGKNVDLELQSSDMYSASDIDPTYYVYEDKPANWGSGRVSVQDGYVSSYSASSGAVTMTEQPATYYVRAVLNGYYDEFMEVTVPASGNVPLSDYNDGGEDIEKVNMLAVASLSPSNLDLGIDTNETSDATYHTFANINVADDSAFRLDEIKFREDATYSFATDSDGDGIYDEGINKIDFIIDGERTTLFDVASSIDEFSGDDEARIDISSGASEFKEVGENGVLSFKFEVICDQTLDTTGDADEKCGNGEDFLDSVILVDSAGNTASFDLLG